MESDLVEQTISKNRVIEKEFVEAAGFINKYNETEGGFPEQEDYLKWAELQTDVTYLSYFRISKKDFPKEVIDIFGEPLESGVLLSYWRGEWFEYYASWSRKSTLSFEESDYYLTGSRWGQFTVIHLIPSVLLFISSIIVGRRYYRGLAGGKL